MKSFLEEYGFAILAAIVVILLIAMATPVGNLIKEQVMGMVNKFSGSADKKLDASMGGEFSANLVNNGGKIDMTIFSPSSTDEFTYVVHYVAAGQKANIKVEDAGINNTSVDGVQTIATYVNKETKVGKEPSAAPDNRPVADAGRDIYVVVTNTGTGEVFQTNTVKAK